MSILSALGFDAIEAITGEIGKTVRHIVKDPNQAALLEKEITKTVLANEGTFIESASKIIEAEAKSHWYASSWRPTLMYLLMAEIVWLTVGVPVLGLNDLTLAALAAVPGEFWTLLMIGLGGYIAGRSGEKIASTMYDKKEENPG